MAASGLVRCRVVVVEAREHDASCRQAGEEDREHSWEVVGTGGTNEEEVTQRRDLEREDQEPRRESEREKERPRRDQFQVILAVEELNPRL